MTITCELELANGATLSVPCVCNLGKTKVIDGVEKYYPVLRRSLFLPPRPIFNKAAAISISKRVPGHSRGQTLEIDTRKDIGTVRFAGRKPSKDVLGFRPIFGPGCLYC